MAAPTLAAIKALADAWWTEPATPTTHVNGVPRLEVLVSRVAALFTSPRAVVRARILNNNSVYSLQADLEILESTPGAGDGQLVQRTWTPANGARQEDLADVFDPSLGRSARQDAAAVAAAQAGA